MHTQTIIIMGPSGSGKGTQATLLKEYLEQHDPRGEVLYVQVGKHFRDIAAEDSFTSRILKSYIEEGKLAPKFLTVWAWGTTLIKHFTGEEHLIFDGTPRRLEEAKMLDEALQFYRRSEVTVVSLDVSKELSRKRLAARGRADDLDPEDVERRLAWYDTEVTPVLDFFKQNATYKVHEIDGERNIEEIHQSIVKALF